MIHLNNNSRLQSIKSHVNVYCEKKVLKVMKNIILINELYLSVNRRLGAQQYTENHQLPRVGENEHLLGLFYRLRLQILGKHY